MKKFSTTIYVPMASGHYFKSEEPTGNCIECDGHSWDKQHALTEQHEADIYEMPHEGLFCVEASDNRGQSYSTNGLRWADIENAERWASGLSMRWFGCTHIRVRACDENGDPTGDTVKQTL